MSARLHYTTVSCRQSSVDRRPSYDTGRQCVLCSYFPPYRSLFANRFVVAFFSHIYLFLVTVNNLFHIGAMGVAWKHF